MQSLCKIWQSRCLQLCSPTVQHKIFVDSLHERFRVLKALERKTKFADLRALFLNATSFARDEGIESKHSDEADTSHIALAATDKRPLCTICDKRTHTNEQRVL
jgi:hypothetical protein